MSSLIDTNSRKEYIDIFKGLLIIGVILGHSYLKYKRVVFLFHMPLFFILSGFLFKTPENTNILTFIVKKFRRLIIPYFSFGILIALLTPGTSLISTLKSLIYGGREIGGVYWFITCLFLSEIFVFIIGKYRLYIIYPVLFILAIIESNYILHFMPPTENISFWWNIDVCLLAVPYMAIGYFLKATLSHTIEKDSFVKFTLKNITCSMSCLLLLTSLMFLCKFEFRYIIDMKYGYYANPILVLLFPFLFGYFFLLISLSLSHSIIGKIIGTIGTSSMTIMYIHLFVRDYIMQPLCEKRYSILLWILITCILGITFDTLCKKSRILCVLFGICNSR